LFFDDDSSSGDDVGSSKSVSKPTPTASSEGDDDMFGSAPSKKKKKKPAAASKSSGGGMFDDDDDDDDDMSLTTPSPGSSPSKSGRVRLQQKLTCGDRVATVLGTGVLMWTGRCPFRPRLCRFLVTEGSCSLLDCPHRAFPPVFRQCSASA
jgi:hypothetical protein